MPVLAVVALLASCGGGSSQTSAGASHALNGADVYKMSCARCHGTDRQGVNGAPRLDPVRLSSTGETSIRMIISYGKGRMPAFGGLSTEKVDMLLAYLKGS
jgi:mono/diheme cytochrome c family protein